MPRLVRTPPPAGRSWHPNTPVNGLEGIPYRSVSPSQVDPDWRAPPQPYSPPSRDTPGVSIPSTPTSSTSAAPSTPSIDLHSLEYVYKIDENLICPICRFALVEPVTTKCEHTFCKDCFNRSYQIAPICPIDRLPLQVPTDMSPGHRLILNQLDALEVMCPNTKDGCEKILARSMVQNHVDKYCTHALVSCPDSDCDNKVLRKDVDRGCTHYPSVCPDCAETLMEADMERHRVVQCVERKTNCEKCGSEILRYQADSHENECEEAVVPCKWVIYGCVHTSKRKDLAEHAPLCDFKIMGPVVDTLKDEVNNLRAEVQSLKEKDKAKDRRIRFLETDKSLAPSASTYTNYLEPEESSTSAIENPPYDSRDQYLLSLLESQENKVESISAGLTDLEAKQTMMLFNETIPIKEQLAELRSAQGVLGMHVRWLMNFRIQERRPGGGGSSAPNTQAASGSDAASSSSRTTLPPPRRLSDSLRENVTKL